MRKRVTITAAVWGLIAILGASAAHAQNEAAPAREKEANSAQDKSAANSKLEAETFIEQHDKNGDGQLSQDELPGKLRSHFDVLDRNNDKLLSKQELEKHGLRMMRRLQPEAVTFVWIIAAERDQPSLQELQATYETLRKLDSDDNGTITQAEIKSARQELCERRVDSLIKHMDENGDGKISEQESQGELDVAFDKVDANGDGFVSREELLQCVSGAAEERTAERSGTSTKKN
jgi:Ca2+-binding EF-hand superfamily protein